MKTTTQLWTLLLLVCTAVGLKDPVCELQPFKEGVGGTSLTCYADIRVFSYNQFANECSQWNYGGCGGNKNMFFSIEQCEAKCLE